jgi:hypothetical protein
MKFSFCWEACQLEFIGVDWPKIRSRCRSAENILLRVNPALSESMSRLPNATKGGATYGATD